jgi:peptide/nickel transport system substrate-binding protein
MKNLIYIVLFSFVLFSCSTQENNEIDNQEQNNLRLNIASKIKTLYPPAINDVYSMQVASQIFEGLVKFNPSDLTIEPAISKTWEINDDFTEYTFFLRKDVFFHDNACFPDGKGRKLTANDVKYAFTNLCSQKYTNNNFKATLLNVVGAEDYYNTNNDTASIEGIEIINDYTIKIKLRKSMPFFLNALALPAASIYPKEAFDKYKEQNYVGTGAFYLTEFPKTDKIVLIKNTDYYFSDENNEKLPYIDTVFIGVENSIQKEIAAFTRGDIDVILNIPGAYISEFMDKHIKDFESNPPKYVVINYTEDENSEMYNIMKSSVHNFYTNNMNYLDLSIVYLEEPVAKNDSVLVKK